MWKTNLIGAAGKDLDFEKITSGKYDPQDLEKSMLGIASEIEPKVAQK